MSESKRFLLRLNPALFETLRRWAYGKPGVAVHRRDAYEALKAFLPPAVRNASRG